MQLPQTTPHMPNCSALYRFGYNNSLQLNEQLLSRVSFDHAPDQVQLARISALMAAYSMACIGFCHTFPQHRQVVCWRALSETSCLCSI